MTRYLVSIYREYMETILNFRSAKLTYGFHISKLDTLENSFLYMNETPLRAYQIYIANPRSWKPPSIDIEDVKKAKVALENKYLAIHASLLYNIAGATNGDADSSYQLKLNNTRVNLLAELDVGVGLGSGVVVHTGSRIDETEGIKDAICTLNYALENEGIYSKDMAKMCEVPLYEFKRNRKVILENSAGEGNKLGSSLESIAEMIYGADEDYQDQIKVCIDTAHAAGYGKYDFGKEEDVVMFYYDFNQIIGIDKLELFHLNDTRKPIGSRVDLHENLGIGYMFSSKREDGIDGTKGLKTLLEYADYYNTPLIGEPPAKAKDKSPGPGGRWDYEVINKLYNIYKTVKLCSKN